jgi:hypothetical protein
VGSGKSEITRLLVARFGYVEINSGQLVGALLGLPPLNQIGRARFQEAAEAFISQPDGPGRLADALVQEVRRRGARKTLVDGPRHWSTLEAFRRVDPGRRTAMIYVHTPFDAAYRFFRLREAAPSQDPLAEFLRVRSAPVEAEVEGLIRHSDAVVYNWFGLKRLHRQVQRLVQAATGVD